MLNSWIGAALLATLATLALLARREFWAFDPRTPFFLDRAGRTRWPEAPGSVRRVFVGDILLGDAGAGRIAERGHDHPFAATRELLLGADLAVGSLEAPSTLQQEAAIAKRWNYRMEPEAAAALRRAGFGAMNLANTHILDRGEIGLLESLQQLRAAGLPASGAGRNDAEAHAGMLLEVRGQTWKNLGDDKKHVDNHALWINPNDNKHIRAGCDGGVYETFDQAKNWDFKSNIPIAEIYKVTTVYAEPFYNVYIGTQDNKSLAVLHEQLVLREL